jgi:putative tricarboxylic transport membrane protein
VFFPRLLIGVLAVLSIVLLCQSVKFKAAQAPGAARTPVDGNAIVLRWALVGLTAVYLCLLPLLGYLYATIPFLFAGMSLLGPVRRRNLAIYAVTSVAITLALQFIFATLLKLFLP